LSCRRCQRPFLFCVAVRAMTRLILAGQSGVNLFRSGLADVVIPFVFRFVWGPLPSPDELATYLAARSEKHAPGTHWSDFAGPRPFASKAREDLGLVEFCRHCETIELWFDLAPNDQLQLVWLLDYFRSYPEVVARFRLRLVDFDLLSWSHAQLGRWERLGIAVDVTRGELETAGVTGQAYRTTSPEACVDLLDRDLSALPLLKPALTDLLKELPSRSAGLGATARGDCAGL
jgi:hypothetical protein